MVTIDGQERTGKNKAGELLAQALGGLLVDWGRFYRSVTQAAWVAEVDWDDRNALESFCAGARLDAVIRPNDRGILEALATVNSGLVTDASMVSVDSARCARRFLRCSCNTASASNRHGSVSIGQRNLSYLGPRRPAARRQNT